LNYRNGKKSALLSFLPVSIFYISVAFIVLYFIYPHIYLLKNEVLITLTFFALWRYGWMILNYSRALIYRVYAYPKIKSQIADIPESKRYPKHLYFMIPSYKEESWVSIETFRSIISEVQKIPSDVTIVVATAEDKEDAVITQMFNAYKSDKKIDLIFQHQKAGKRIAMGHALRTIARKYHSLGLDDPNSVTIFMDGDSYMEDGFLEKLLPFFATDKNLGAVTTNEAAFIDSRSKWYKEWFNLKFGQRHIQFQAHSLSRKVMTLTGRLSAYRTDIAVKEDFIKIIENDILIHPLYGKFRFLMGDDKSSWFYLLKNRYDMLYIPDILCYSLESRDGNFLELSRSLPFRWNGNTLRNHARALALGMRVTGIYIWFVILDQKLNMWTSLVGIFSALILAIFKSVYYLLFFFVWISFVRVFQLFVISLGGHPVSIYTLPLMLYTQWTGAFIKISAYHDLANQKWSKNGEVQSSDDNTDMIKHPLVKVIPNVIKYSSFTAFIFLLMFSHGVFYTPRLNAINFTKTKPVIYFDNRSETVDLKSRGVGAYNSRKNAQIINDIIRNSTTDSLVLKFPSGNIDIYEPIIINRNNVTLQGSEDMSVIISHLKRPYLGAILVSGERKKRIGYLKEDINKESSILKIDFLHNKIPTPYLLIREPNDKKFLEKLGSLRWDKKYPYLRQQIIKTVSYDPQEHLIYTKRPLSLAIQARNSEIYTLKMVENVHLKDFKIKQVVPDDDISKYSFVYENKLPEYQVDAIRFDYVSQGSIEGVKIENAGRHALVFENCYDMSAERLTIDKSWNKGKGGSGYLRVARTYHSEIKNSDILNIRHLVLQWSSAKNHLHHLNMSVDLNLHGGYTHDNQIDNITFNIPKKHHWDAIEHTPKDAKWAPPDGKNFIDKRTIIIRK
jgi:glycosyltransferase Alg8